MSLTGSNEQWSVVVFIKAFNVGSSAENQGKMLDVVEMLFNISVLLFPFFFWSWRNKNFPLGKILISYRHGNNVSIYSFSIKVNRSGLFFLSLCSIASTSN